MKTDVQDIVQRISQAAVRIYNKLRELYKKGFASLPEPAQKKITLAGEFLRKYLLIVVEKVKTFDRHLLTYVPFIGWMYPVWKYPEEEFIMSHARQAVLMAGFFALVETVLYTSTFMVPSGWRVARLVMILAIYLLDIFYFTWAVKGTMMIRKGERIEIPFFARYAERLEI